MDTHRRYGAIRAGLAIVGLLVMVAASILVPLAPAARAATIDVGIDNLAFLQPHVTVNVGDTVRWTNSDSVAHTVTSDTAAWTERFLNPTQQATVTFNTVGVFNYHCRLHPSMTGSVTVQNVIPEFSSEFFVVIGLTAMMFGLMIARRRHD